MDRLEPENGGLVTAEQPAKPDPSASSAVTENGVVEALIRIARHHGRSANRAELVRGLPVGEKGLAVSNIEEAARRLDLDVVLEQRDIGSIPAVTLPVIAILDGRPAVVVERIDRKGNSAEISRAGQLQGSQTVPLSDFKASKHPVVVFVRASASGETDFSGQNSTKHWFWSAALRFWPNYLQVVVAALIGNLLALASPLFIMNVYDRVIPNLAIPTLWVLTAGVVIAFLFDFILKVLRMRIVDETGRRVDMAVAGRLFDHFLRMKLAVRPASTGVVANQVRDLDSVRDALTSSSVIAVTDLLFIGIFIWVMWMLVGPLAFVPLAAVPVIIGVTGLVQIPLTRALAQSQQDSARRQSVLVEAVSSLDTIKASGAETWFRTIWDRAVAAASRSTTQARYWANLAASFTSVVFQSVSIVIVVWGVFLVLEGRITVGALIAANILAGRVLSPLNNITQTLSRLVHARTALRSLNALMKTETERSAKARDLTAVNRGAIAFQKVRFSYPGSSQPALELIDFTVGQGERIGIIGRVGSGKSSLIRLLSGLYEPQEGAVLLGGVDTRQFSPADMRQEIGLCLQDAELFTGSLRENILIGARFATASDLERAVHLSGVDAFASAHPQGLDLHIEERGRSLSGGQRQSVALARCLIRSPNILCLDEPTAYLDIMSEKQLCQRLRTIAETGITVFIATHRDGPLELVDRLMLLEKGRLLMDGPKQEVLARLRAGAQTAQNGTFSNPGGSDGPA